ncbi:MAG: AMP-binding protein [Betaproteobacteria bacterium]|nr:MAG: AMP-binding protein [Betaproteobacteria bacterium]
MKSFLKWTIGWLLAVRIVGDDEQCEQERRVLVVANIPSRVAGLLLGLYLPCRPLVVMPPGATHGVVERILLRLVDHIVLDVNNPLILKRLTRLLRQGRPVVTFPEGRVNDGQSVLKVYPVPALAAINSGASIIPVAISSASIEPGASGSRRTRRGVTLRVLPSTRIESAQAGGRRRQRAVRQLEAIMQRVRVAAFGRKSVFESFLDAIARYGRSREMIEDQDEQVRTYGTVLKGSLVISRWIRRYTRSGENVGMLLPNVIPSVCAVLGLAAAGRVPAIFNFTAGSAAVKSAAIAAGVRTVITSSKFIARAQLEPLLEVLGDYRIIYLEDIRGELGLLDKLWLMTFALWFPRKVMAKPAMSDPSVVLFTSGSEDRPKGVVLSHEAVISNVAQIRSVFDFSPRDKIFNPLPMYHAYSFTAGLILSLVTGTPMFLYVSPLKYRAIPELVYRRDCTVLYGTSTFLSYYAQNAEPMDFRKLRYVIAGGEKLSDDVALTWLNKFGLRIYEGYGTTEAAPVVSLATNDTHRLGHVGRFLPGVEHQIQRVEGINRGGVLHIRAPNLMLGYYRVTRPGVIEGPRSAIGVGWYDTGDVVDVDDDGLVTILGRTKRFTKVAGEMVSLDVMEKVASAASPGHHHAAIALLQKHGTETTLLFTTDATLTRAELAEAARASGAPELAVARKLVALPEIPLLSNGKTDYVSLKSLAEDDTYGRLLSAAAGRSITALQEDNADSTARAAGRHPGA